MPSLDSLPGEQRAVLEMILKHGRSYDEIARLLSRDRDAIRERAQIALDSIGPHTEVAPEHQHRIADYLLGQLSDAEAAEVRDLLADSPSDRAWARVVSSELTPLAGGNPLPEIPVERSAPPRGRRGRRPSRRRPPTRSLRCAPEPAAPEPPVAPPSDPTASGLGPAQRTASPSAGAAAARKRDDEDAAAPATRAVGAASRLGGAVVLLAGVIAVAAVLFFVVRGGHSKQHTASTPDHDLEPLRQAQRHRPRARPPPPRHRGRAPAWSRRSTCPRPPSAKNSKAAGIAEVLNEGSVDGIAVVAQNVPANTTKPPNAYAVLALQLAQGRQAPRVREPRVGKPGRLQRRATCPTNASHYKQLIVTVETTASPKQPGTIILQGALTGL